MSDEYLILNDNENPREEVIFNLDNLAMVTPNAWFLHSQVHHGADVFIHTSTGLRQRTVWQSPKEVAAIIALIGEVRQP